ncbi:MAG: GNAT family N-acetyltransferase [Nevskia sp.]|nr:GNAT family N-acetyltransferase [Nevskia sp.]
MNLEAPTLHGRHVRLEPLETRHIPGLSAASAGDAGLYQWSPVPRGLEEAERYVAAALAMRDAGTALPFATVRQSDGGVIGSTRFFLMEWWAWPAGHERQARSAPDACEIGYTWLAPGAVRSGANTEAKLLMLRHAFETWGVLRVCLHTDVRNARSRAAMERIGCQFEGVLRSHRLAADFIARDSARYSIVAAEWPGVRQRIEGLMAAYSTR